jgi:hypothetical protein
MSKTTKSTPPQHDKGFLNLAGEAFVVLGAEIAEGKDKVVEVVGEKFTDLKSAISNLTHKKKKAAPAKKATGSKKSAPAKKKAAPVKKAAPAKKSAPAKKKSPAVKKKPVTVKKKPTAAKKKAPAKKAKKKA